MKVRFFILLLILASLLVFTDQPSQAKLQQAVKKSASDPFNTYQFQRKNSLFPELPGSESKSKGPWFEWWYYKVVIPETQESYYFVYGVVNPWDKMKTNSASKGFVGMGDFNSHEIFERHYTPDQFSAAYDKVEVLLGGGEQRATDKTFSGSLVDPQGNPVSWNIDIEKRWAFNATSWATGHAMSDVEWYPAQADARCSGDIFIHNQKRHFENTTCYQDRNWGSSFPEWWTWIVANHFNENEESALVVGGGKPKVLGGVRSWQGLTVGFKHKGMEYNWRPTDGAHCDFDIHWGKWQLTSTNSTHQIKISGYAPPEKFMDLQFTTPEGKTFHDYETLRADLKVELYVRAMPPGNWKLLDTLTSSEAGLEFGSYSPQMIDSLAFSL